MFQSSLKRKKTNFKNGDPCCTVIESARPIHWPCPHCSLAMLFTCPSPHPPTPALSLMRQSPDDFPLLLKSTLSFWRVEGVCCKLLVLNQGLVCPHTQETTWRALEIFWGVTTGAGKCFPHSVVRGQGCRPKADKTRNSSSQQRIILPKVSGEPESGNAAIAGESRNQAWQGGWARRDPPVGKGGVLSAPASSPVQRCHVGCFSVLSNRLQKSRIF